MDWHKIVTWLQVAGSAIVGGISFFVGELNGILIALLVFMVLDIVTGTIKSIINKCLSSSVSFTGLAKKVLIIFVVGAANIIDMYVLDTGEVIRNAVIFFYITNELISIFENVVECGVPIPQKLKDVLALISQKGETTNGNLEPVGNGGLPEPTGSDGNESQNDQ